jgi:hypothetical protein
MGQNEFKWRSAAQQASGASGLPDELGATRQRLLNARSGTQDMIRWIRRASDGRESSSSPTGFRRARGEPRGSEGVPRFPRCSAGCWASLSRTRKRLVPSARLGAA